MKRPVHDHATVAHPETAGRLVLLVAGGPLGNCVANGLTRAFPDIVILRERPEAKTTVLRRRARLVGPIAAAGQAAAGLVFRVLEKTSRKRLEDICRKAGLDVSEPTSIATIDVGSVNSPACRAALRDLQPAAVAVYGTRIIGRKTLGSIPAPFVNYHAGINPKYRGQHPGYWARACGDPDNTGITIHLVDAGVDTGDVLAQERVELTSQDNIATYQYVQLAAALPLFVTCLSAAMAGRLAPRRVDLASGLWFPPTIWAYVGNGVRKGVW